MVKNNLQPGINYYIIITCYMFYYVLFRIYIFLFWILFSYSMFVTFFQTHVYNFTGILTFLDDPFFNPNLEIKLPEKKLWKDKRIYAIIFCGITLTYNINMKKSLQLKPNIIRNSSNLSINSKAINNKTINGPEKKVNKKPDGRKSLLSRNPKDIINKVSISKLSINNLIIMVQGQLKG